MQRSQRDIRRCVRLTAVAFLTAACSYQSHRELPTLWEKGKEPKTGGEMLRIFKKHLDEHLDSPFPDLEVIAPGKYRSVHLGELVPKNGSVLLIWLGTGCPHADDDLDYYRSVSWRPPNVDRVVVLFARGVELGDYAERLSGPVDVYFSAQPILPGWLAPLTDARPLQFLVDSADWTLADWSYHSGHHRYAVDLTQADISSRYRSSRSPSPTTPVGAEPSRASGGTP